MKVRFCYISVLLLIGFTDFHISVFNFTIAVKQSYRIVLVNNFRFLNTTSGEDVDSASDEDEEEEEEDEEEKEDNPLLVKEKTEKIDKTNLWFNKVM